MCRRTVVEVGRDVKLVRPGDRIAIEPAFSCGRCDQCLAGRENTCRAIRFMGLPGEAPGAAAEYYVLPEENCFPVPELMSLDAAAAVEPLSIGLYAVRLSEMKPNATAAILGAGPIGLSVLLSAKAIFPCRLVVSELISERREVARRCGADADVDAGQENSAAAIQKESPQGFDYVFECSGDPACVDFGQTLLKPGGTLMIVGIPPCDALSFDAHTMRRHELTFKSVRRQKGCMGEIVRLIDAGQIDPASLLTHFFPPEKINEAFEIVAARRDGVVKALIQMQE